MNKVIFAYVPVLHRGYRDFFGRHLDAATLYVFGEDLIEEFDPRRKDVRALLPSEVTTAIESWRYPFSVHIGSRDTLSFLRDAEAIIVMPDEDVCHALVESCLAGYERVIFDSVFLRWDRRNSTAEHLVKFDREVTAEGFVGEVMNLAYKESCHSSDWWRQVGGVIIRDDRVILSAYNRHTPSPHSPYADGDPRNNFKQGIRIELSSAHHAESALIGAAARHGIRLEGANLFVTTFPCPPCGKLISATGMSQCYYVEGYSVLNTDLILQQSGVEIIHVAMKMPPSS